MSSAGTIVHLGAAERIVQSIQNEVDLGHPAYPLLGAALANLSEAAFALQDGAGR